MQKDKISVKESKMSKCWNLLNKCNFYFSLLKLSPDISMLVISGGDSG